MGIESEWPGILGALLIVVGWAFETKNVIETRHSTLPLSFDLLYLAGSALLTLYALSLGSWIFAALNGLATLMAVIGTYFTLSEHRRK